MKKVLASVLAGSMVLGMASMAAAASLVKTSKKGEYDFRLDCYEGKVVSYEKWEEVVEATDVPKTLVKAIEAYEDAYDDFVEDCTEDTAEAVFEALGEVKTEVSNAGVEAAFKAAVGSKKYDITEADFADVSIGASTFSSLKGTAAYPAALAPATNAAKKAIPTPEDLKDATIEVYGSVAGANGLLAGNKDSYELKDDVGNDWNLYTYGVDDTKEVTVRLGVPAKEDFRVDVASGAVTVTRKKVETKNGADYYDIKIKAAAGVRDFELDDYKIEFDLHDSNFVFFIEGSVAYSDYREVAPDERYINTKSTHIDDHTDGCVYDFNEVIDEETRIICNDYVDLLFKGNYGTDFENLRVLDDDIQEVEDFFQDYDIDYYDFVGTPKFAKDITVRIDADSDSYIYEFDKKTGDVVDITDECDYTSDGWTFKRKSLKTYVVLEEPYEGGNVRAEKEPVDDEPTDTEPDDTDATGSKPNPGTGAMPF